MSSLSVKAPIVTGLSPNEGPPGTRVTIRGENFGKQPYDLVGLTICGFDCLLSAEWKSPSKIIAISGPVKGKGEVIVTTKLGGKGTCNVTFKGYHETVGPMKESAVWVEETPLFGWGRHSLSPTVFQQDDPLGLSIEENEKKFPEETLFKLFSGQSGDISAKNFSPAWFLLENHQSTSFNDLQAGLIHLRRKVEGQKEGQLSFLKANIGCVMDQIDTLVNLHEKLKLDFSKFDTRPTYKLEKLIKESEIEARKLFADVLSRKERAEKTRNALNVLHRFKFLFCLPCAIDRNIAKGDYDVIINDYIRVKNLFNKTEIPIFKMALLEIDKHIQALQVKLHNDLTKMPISVENQKRLIKYLISLDAPYDSAWDAIKCRAEYLNEKILSIYEYHKNLNKDQSGKSKLLQTMSMTFLNYKNSAYEASNVPTNISFCEELCIMISENFPDLWKLGQAYFHLELKGNIDASRSVDFKTMVMSLMEQFSELMRSGVMPHSLGTNIKFVNEAWLNQELDNVALYLPELVRSVRSTYTTLIKLDLPRDALNIVQALLADLRIHCMSVLFKQATSQVKLLEENWKIDLSEKHSGVTQLPTRLQKIIDEVIQVIKESVLIIEHRETSLTQNTTAQNELDKQVESMLMAFHNVLIKLSTSEDDSDEDGSHPSVVSQLIGTPISSYRMQSSKNQPAWEYRLLMTLSNCQHTKVVVLKNISNSFKESGLPQPKNAINNINFKLEVLEKSILEKYLEYKSDPLVGTIEPSMYLGRFDWDTNVVPNDIRPYAKECINNLIHLHSEVNNISPNLLDCVLPQVVETIAEELYRLMSCVRKFSNTGAQQATADIYALQYFFEKYSNEKAKEYFQEALEIIPSLNEHDLKLVEVIIGEIRTGMKIQYYCLTNCKNGFLYS